MNRHRKFSKLFVEFVLGLVLLDVVLVALLEVLRQHDVAILADGLETEMSQISI